MKRILGPNLPGPGRRLAARAGVLLVASFLLAGLVIVGLIGLGYEPIN